MNKDTVVGILGAVILVAAMVAIFYYEGTQAPGATGTPGGPGTGTGLFSLANGTGPALTGTATEGGEPDEQTVTLNQSNLAAVEFTLTWTDDLPGAGPPGQNAPNDVFEFSVTGPGGQTGSSSGAPECDANECSLALRVNVNQAPPATRGATLTNGSGAWTVLVTLSEAGDAAPTPAPSPVPIPGVTDTGNDWALATSYSYYSAN